MAPYIEIPWNFKKKFLFNLELIVHKLGAYIYVEHGHTFTKCEFMAQALVQSPG